MGMERFVRPVSLDLPGARGSGRGDQLANHTSGPAWDKLKSWTSGPSWG